MKIIVIKDLLSDIMILFHFTAWAFVHPDSKYWTQCYWKYIERSYHIPGYCETGIRIYNSK